VTALFRLLQRDSVCAASLNKRFCTKFVLFAKSFNFPTQRKSVVSMETDRVFCEVRTEPSYRLRRSTC